MCKEKEDAVSPLTMDAIFKTIIVKIDTFLEVNEMMLDRAKKEMKKEIAQVK